MAEWWRNAVVYQIYVRSFADSDGDGIGDFRGVIQRFDHLVDLGVDAVWFNPFYLSPLADGGYDIVDHRDVDPLLGALADFDELIALAHRYGIKIIVDIVPNHTSDQHPWFQDALRAGRDSAERERYIFRDGAGDQPPSDWRSHFGGSAWEQVEDGQWYCHLFGVEQPDLNWDHPDVRSDFRDTLRFWAGRGVDGFRIDVAHALAKDLSEPLRSQPNLDRALPADGTDPLYDRDEVHAIYREWRRILDEYDPPRMAVAETWPRANQRTYLYTRPDELDQTFDFSLQKTPWDRVALQSAVEQALRHQADTGSTATWTLSSHDVVRHPSRLALPLDVDLDDWLASDGAQPAVDPLLAERRARAAALMMLALPGSSYLYQGDELGLLEVPDLPETAIRDPIWHRSGRRIKGRDGCRVPLPWTTTGPSLGFGPGVGWLPQPASFAAQSIEAQHDDPDSTLTLYRTALLLRRQLQSDDDDVTWCSDDPHVLHFRRPGNWHCLVNFGPDTVATPQGRLLLKSQPLVDGRIPADTTVWTSEGC